MNGKSCGFFGYMRAVADTSCTGFAKGIKKFLPLILADVLIYVFMTLAKITSDGYDDLNIITLVYIFNFILFLSCGFSGASTKIKPNLSSVCPISYRKRVLYDSVCGLLFSICLFALLLTALFVVLAIPVFLVSWILLNFGLIIDYIKLFSSLGVAVDAGGIAFLVLYTVLTYGVSLLLAFIGRARNRYIVAFSYAAGMGILTQILINLSSGSGGYSWRYTAIENFGDIRLSWLWLVLFAIVASGAVVGGIVLAVTREKPRDI